jgi:hypothetical protein
MILRIEVPMFSRVNALLAKKQPYIEAAFQTHLPLRHCLERMEQILISLERSGMLPPVTCDSLAYWLLHESPLTNAERDEVRLFLFEVDYY